MNLGQNTGDLRDALGEPVQPSTPCGDNSIESTDVDFHITVNEALPDISVDADDRRVRVGTSPRPMLAKGEHLRGR